MTLVRFAGFLLSCALLSAGALGCSSDGEKQTATGGGGGSGAGTTGGSGNVGGKGVHVPVAGMNNSGFPDDDGVYVGSVDVETGLPPLPLLTNVVARLNDDSTKIVFDPFEGAIDYRVYVLPSDDKLDIRADGQVVIPGATYRCAGTREAPPVVVDDAEYIKSSAIRTMVANQMVGGYLRKPEDAVLGYVYTGPGEGLVPVYTLGDPGGNADVDCFFNRYQASRVKKYTTSKEERDALLGESARDDGIAFYVPAAASGTTRQIYDYLDAPGERHQATWLFPEGPEADAHGDKKNAVFVVEKEAGPNRLPLMRVFYGNVCGASHDELAVGTERFNLAYKQGDKQPFWSLLWTGITGPTTLVVEALDNGCPQTGHLSTSSFPSFVTTFGDVRFVNEPFVTWDQAREASATKELFVNGQYGPPFVWQAEKLVNGMQPAAPAAPLPKAIARAFVKVEPLPHPEMDFFADFDPGSTLEPFVEATCSAEDCPSSGRRENARFDLLWTEIQSHPDTKAPLALIDQQSGELWVTYADAAADTNGKFRLTAKQKANVEADKFLHVTMEVNSMSSARRYPQIIVTDQDAPIQFRLKNGRSIVVQPRAEVAEFNFPVHYQIEVCKLRPWDVNDQCPVYDLHRIPGKDGGDSRLAPNAEVGELTGADQRLKYDAYISTKKVYLFLDGKPYACANLPTDSAPNGPVTVTWGDVLYHSAVDAMFSYHASHWQIHTQRHFDNLGFSSGVAEPGWDENRLPCVAPIDL